MSFNERLIIPVDQVHSKGEVDPQSYRNVPVGDAYLPVHSGRLADWARDDLTNYVQMPGDVYSRLGDQAHDVKIDIQTSFNNSRRYHSWKGYNDIEAVANTVVSFNNIVVGQVRVHPSDILRHLVAVNDYITQIRELPFGGWWTPEDVAAEIGRQVDYDGCPGVIMSVDGLGSGEITVYAPTWPDDGYDRGGILRVPLTYEKLNWYPDPSRGRVYVPENPYGTSDGE